MVAVVTELMVGGENSTEDDSTRDPLGLRSLSFDSERCASHRVKQYGIHIRDQQRTHKPGTVNLSGVGCVSRAQISVPATFPAFGNLEQGYRLVHVTNIIRQTPHESNNSHL
jgi:hypothetical protein